MCYKTHIFYFVVHSVKGYEQNEGDSKKGKHIFVLKLTEGEEQYICVTNLKEMSKKCEGLFSNKR